VRQVPGVEMLSVRELNRRFAPESRPLAWSELADLAERIAASDRIGAEEPVASPSQALDVLARVLLRASAGPVPSHVPLRRVLGPAAPSAPLERSVRVGQAEGEALCRELVRHVDAAGALPAALRTGQGDVGPGPLLRALARALAGLSRGAPFEGLALEPGAEEPEIGARVVEERVYGMLPNWTPHDPNLRLEQLALHTRLQCWTMKPAVLA